MLRRTLNDFFEVEGNSLISNNYQAFDTDILEIRMQTMYGNRPLRPFIDSKIKIMAQNVVDMWSGYLTELFTFPEQYNILIPELKEIARSMDYKKTNDDTRDITGSHNGTSNTKTTGSGTDHSTTNTSGTDNRIIDGTQTTTYGKGTDTIISETYGDKGEDNATDTTTHTGTAETIASGTNGDTLTKSVSAYNQTTPTYAPTEQDVTSGDNSSTSTLTNNLEDKTIHEGTYEKNQSKQGNNHVQESGTDGVKTDTTDNLTSAAETTVDSNKSDTSTTDGTTSNTSTSQDIFTGSESYNLNENIKETGHLSYDEILHTIDNLFNPYDWLATKIVNTICEVIYAERIR